MVGRIKETLLSPEQHIPNHNVSFGNIKIVVVVIVYEFVMVKVDVTVSPALFKNSNSTLCHLELNHHKELM